MSKIFIEILNMSISASFVAVIVMLIRLFIKKMPKKYSYILWAVVFFRLIFPFSIHLPVSAVPVQNQTIPQDIVYSETPAIQSGLTGIDSTVNHFISTALPPVNHTNSVNPIQIVLEIGSTIWLAGLAVILIYLVISYLRLKRKISTAIKLRENIYKTDLIKSPFVFGIVRPKIYMPMDFDEERAAHILMHEQTHIKRFDYLIKPLAFLVLAVHWFNPFVWVSFALMSEDMELSADEAVINRSRADIRGDYSNSLLAFAFSKKRSGLLSPLAFGETGVAERVVNVLKYKKPAFWISTIAVVIVILSSALLISCASVKPSQEIADTPPAAAEPTASPANTSVGEVYENAEVGIGIVFPPEYIGKYSISQSDVLTFTVNLNEGGCPFYVTKWPVSALDSLGNMLNGGTLMLQDDEYAYYLYRCDPPAGISDEPDSPAKGEYLALFSDDMIHKIVASAFLLSQPASPVYSSKARVTDEGLQDDYIYTFPSGNTLNPQVGEPLLLLNGSFCTMAVGMMQSYAAYVPLGELARAFGGTETWNVEHNEVVYQINGQTMDVTVGEYGTATATLDGKSCNAPLYANDTEYVTFDFINKYMNLDAGYLSPTEVSVAENPVIWVDIPGSSYRYSQASSTTLDWLKAQLNQGLENFKTSSSTSSSKTPEDAVRVAPDIASDIDHTTYLGQAGRYALYGGVRRTILVDTETNDIYFYDAENAYGSITKVDLNDPDLYSMGYIFG